MFKNVLKLEIIKVIEYWTKIFCRSLSKFCGFLNPY